MPCLFLKTLFVFVLCALPCEAVFEPKRVVSLAPVITESMFALRAQDKLVGVTRFCDRPLAAKKIKKIGGFIDPQLEAILLLQPDLVIGMAIPSHLQILAELKKRQIATLKIEANTIADIRNSIFSIARAVNREKNGKIFLENFDKELAFLKTNLKCLLQASILLAISSMPFIVAGPHTFANEVLELFNMKSAVPSSAPAWPLWSVEAILQNPPRAIVATEGANSLQALRQHLAPILHHPALKNTQLIAHEKSILQRPGPYLIEDIKQFMVLLKKYGICHSKTFYAHKKS